MHKQVRKLRGPASAQLCVRCEGKARHWAQLHTEDGLDPWADYVPLCMSCHQIYDRVNVGHQQTAETREKIASAARGRTLSPEHKEALINSRKGMHVSEVTRAKMRESAKRRWARQRDSDQ